MELVAEDMKKNRAKKADAYNWLWRYVDRQA
jgi:hypothetical protein